MEVKRALISVSDKTGLEEFVKGLKKSGVEILSTGGTAKSIRSMGIEVTDVSSCTGFPEMLDGRVKTLHPKIHGGILAVRSNPEHMEQLDANDILPIDMVVVNLYPFEETVSKTGVTEEEAIENIDIGGPTMLRSAAKNFQSVAVVSSSGQYESVLEELVSLKGSLSEKTLRSLACSVFACTNRYDAAITEYLERTGIEEKKEDLPNMIDVGLEKIKQLRYGENPHQKAAYYRNIKSTVIGAAEAHQLQGKELSFNNILDLNAAVDMVSSFDEPVVAVVKHNNPCGIAAAGTVQKAYVDALDCDRLSAFGSIMGFNRAIDEKLAVLILEEADFIECIIAPDYDEGALRVFSCKKNLRVLKRSSSLESLREKFDIKVLTGGALVQDKDMRDLNIDEIKVVTKKKPSDEILSSLLFGWKTVKFVKSNAIVLCQGTKAVGIGAGQMSRVDSVIIAVRKAAERAKGSILASDAFFPKADSIEQAHASGISAIIQPGGSIKDQEVIDACDKFGIPMVFTGIRHFKH